MKYKITYEFKDRKTANKILERLTEDDTVVGITETTKTQTVLDADGNMTSFTYESKVVATVSVDDAQPKG